jgi:hypothetical protein
VLTELPPRVEERLDAVLSPRERTIYEAARLEAVARLSGLADAAGDEGRFQVLAALTRLREIACHARLVDPAAPAVSAKLEVLLEKLDEALPDGRQVLVFSQFTRHLEIIKEALDARGVSSLVLEGKTSARERERRVDAFQRGEGKVFLISLRAGGTGLNLTAADTVFLMDPWWNPAVEDQAADRAHRIGQKRSVTIVRIVAKDTVEEKVLALQAEKRDLVTAVLEGTERAGKLSVRELVALLGAGARERGEEELATEIDAPGDRDLEAALALPPPSAPVPAAAKTSSDRPLPQPPSWDDLLAGVAKEAGKELAASSAAVYLRELARVGRETDPGLSPIERILRFLEAGALKPDGRSVSARGMTVSAIRRGVAALEGSGRCDPALLLRVEGLASAYRAARNT